MRERRSYAVFVIPHEPQPEPVWRPLVDVYRLRDGWLLKFDLAGVRMQDVTVQVAGDRVTVNGERRDCLYEEGCRHFLMEISYSRFERAVQLPESVEQAGVRMEFRDGILLVRLQRPGVAGEEEAQRGPDGRTPGGNDR